MAAFASITGRLGFEPELRFTTSGTPVVNLSVANNRTVKTGEQKETIADWFKITVFGRDAETISQYAKKGSALAFNGRLQNEKYVDRDGQERTVTVLIASSFEFMPSGKRNEEPPAEAPVNIKAEPPVNKKKATTRKKMEGDSDIPF
ncbi:MAG TPA: single-stranded DNA-binding protein [Blastocatellia bacterium]|nr:single-stranded DNA-binding protein [Blastocatellia bacterium]HMY73948.1 single-stranded DNA-binding protein [Blastocatellia bacterium]HMZ17542.1 single-stranded DNA-binding protein [Blastocatellia bacterium]